MTRFTVQSEAGMVLQLQETPKSRFPDATRLATSGGLSEQAKTLAYKGIQTLDDVR